MIQCMCAQTRPLFTLSSKKVLGNGTRNHVNSKGKIPYARGGSNPRHCFTQDSKPNILATELFCPLPPHPSNQCDKHRPSSWPPVEPGFHRVASGWSLSAHSHRRERRPPHPLVPQCTGSPVHGPTPPAGKHKMSKVYNSLNILI